MPFSDLNHALQAKEFDRAEAIWQSEGLDLNAQSSHRSLLWWAADGGHREMAQWLLARGANPNQPSGPTQQETPLTVAVRQGHLDLINDLVAHGGDVNQADDDGMTLLMKALHHPTRPRLLVERLLALGADPHRQTVRYGSTALMIALNEGRLDVIQALADAKVDPHQANREGRLPLHVVVKKHRLDVLEEFLAVFPDQDLDRPMKNGTVALSQSYASTITAMLLRAGANPSVRSTNPFDEGRTPLMGLLGSESNAPIVEIALRKDAPVADADFTGKTNLGYAIEAGNVTGMELLYLHGLPLHSPATRLGLSPYHLLLNYMAEAGPDHNDLSLPNLLVGDPAKDAANAAAHELGEMLDRLHVPVDLPVSPGDASGVPLYSPLAQAMTNERALFFAPALIERGANPNHRGPNGRAPIHALITLDRKLSHALRQSAGVTRQVAQMRAEVRETPLTEKELAHLTAQEEAARMARTDAQAAIRLGLGALTAHGPLDPTVVDNRGWTALDMAAREGAAQVATALIQAGHDPLAPNADGVNPITQALHAGQVVTLHAMIEATAAQGRPWAPTLDDLVLASPEEYPARTQFTQALQSLAARPEWTQWRDQVDSEGNSALILAAATGQGDLVETWLQLGGATQVNHANALGETALIHAAGQADELAIDALLTAGARADLKTRAGLTPLGLVGTQANLRVLFETPRPPLPALPALPGLEQDMEVAQAIVQASQVPLVAPPVVIWGPIVHRVAPGQGESIQFGVGSPAEQLVNAKDEELGLDQPLRSRKERGIGAKPATPTDPPARPTRRRSP